MSDRPLCPGSYAPVQSPGVRQCPYCGKLLKARSRDRMMYIPQHKPDPPQTPTSR